ncbi:hypothetical protein MGA5115_01354 [Marinomonas gallaica]|uniref:Phospholipase D-like domain-containing protein n=1 Tax=Marinomonas gallaica TaxID=1806667 RepID=A0A1C3JQ49_9GAMM|nr:phospholipase D family protein [Marinomonas gallaica]SBT17245.1 hypothetical protein MGA5115_01354 [Marinomonas gallaica]SBT22421.1 hypothetical protein MGA5116_03041 [Marinomonas gallaica]
MKFVANRVNNVYLRSILPDPINVEVDSVLAAVAYGSKPNYDDIDLVEHCVTNKWRLDIWMRYDHTVPVALPFLRGLLQNQKSNIYAKFIPDVFHPKVIWWKGYGAYIGSANLTEKAWVTNIEAGVFMEDEELESTGMVDELEGFFEYLSSIEKVYPISREYIEEMERLQELNKGVFDKSQKYRKYPKWDGPYFTPEKTKFDQAKDNFLLEWSSTLGIMEMIGTMMIEYRPQWIAEDVPVAWQVDQFLHAYYYTRLGIGKQKPIEQSYQTNRPNPTAALVRELEWWKSRPDSPNNENRMLYEDAPIILELLSKERIRDLSIGDLVTLFSKTHATQEHIIKVPSSQLGRPEKTVLVMSERIPLFAEMMMSKKNSKGQDIRELLDFVLWGGVDSQIWERIFLAGRDPEYKIPRYGLNSIAEVVGWARPEIAPPRNGRTSKALKALGFDVKIY